MAGEPLENVVCTGGGKRGARPGGARAGGRREVPIVGRLWATTLLVARSMMYIFAGTKVFLYPQLKLRLLAQTIGIQQHVAECGGLGGMGG